MIYGNFKAAILNAGLAIRDNSSLVHPKKWQSVSVENAPEMATHEVLNHTFKVAMQHEDLNKYRIDIEPNLPWADDHFLERVGGEPLNPGEQWKNWPWGHSADKFRTQGPNQDQFSHTYMERYWPKTADQIDGVPLAAPTIRYEYGDLMDVVDHLVDQPLSRQAFLPVWFPEDTGVVHGERVPCTLGYHFIMRHGYLHIVYYIRSCDFYRHFRDDIYLTVRLLLWMLEQLREKSGAWDDVIPGMYTMHVTSFHVFRNDYLKLWGARNR